MRRIPLFHEWWFAICSVLIVEALDIFIDQATHSITGDYLGIAFMALYGVYCLQNYVACREVHCAVTGPGFLLAASLMVLRDTGTFDHGVGLPYLAILLAALAGCGLEWRYARRTGSHFFRGADA